MQILAQDGQFFADGFAVRRSFLLEEGESRLISYLSDRGSGAATLSVEGGRLYVKSGRIGVISWSGGAELYPLSFTPPVMTAEKVLSVGAERLTVCISFGAVSEIRLRGAAEHRHEAICPLYLPTVTLLEGQREPILCIRARCEIGEYLALFSFSDGKARLLLEECGESILAEGNEVRVERRYRDLMARRVVTTYTWRGEMFECSREIICAREHICIREEKGLALLEAALAKDDNAIDALLSPAIADAKGIYDYFGRMIAVRPALFSSSPTAAAAIRREGDILVATTYDFEFDERERITNITETN